MDIIIYPAFASVLFLGIHQITKNLSTQKWVGILFSLLAGLSLMAISFESFTTWIISGTLLSIFVFSIYYFFIRFHFEWIPIVFGILPIAKMIHEMVEINNSIVYVGGILMIIISSAILYLSLIHISEPTRRTPISYAV